VPLANDTKPAVVDEPDFERLTAALGFSSQWALNGRGRYVRLSAPVPGSRLTVARLVMGAGPDEMVKYHDRDRTNLRRSNLYTVPGRAKGRELAALAALATPVTNNMKAN
jgi:hypothetical protein